MRGNLIEEALYHALLEAADLCEAVRGMDDEDLRCVRGFLARGEVMGWPAERVHGLCIIEGCERFMNQEVRA